MTTDTNDDSTKVLPKTGGSNQTIWLNSLDALFTALGSVFFFSNKQKRNAAQRK
ncbi:LPXTG cell wall anchor domain-containing protein [Bacillus paramycoides]|uniref:LPXTG cell wall anchor domain-containing protein n=1 Tax=Bacillus paramycoides TaxID=2026194 RepID=UPI00399CAF02